MFCATARGGSYGSVSCRWVWPWVGEEAAPLCWHLIVPREVVSVTTIKCTLALAPVGTTLLRSPQPRSLPGSKHGTRDDGDGLILLAHPTEDNRFSIVRNLIFDFVKLASGRSDRTDVAPSQPSVFSNLASRTAVCPLLGRKLGITSRQSSYGVRISASPSWAISVLRARMTSPP